MCNCQPYFACILCFFFNLHPNYPQAPLLYAQHLPNRRGSERWDTKVLCVVVCPLMEGESFLKWVRIWGKQSEKRRRFGQIAQINQVPPKTVVTPSSTWFFWDLEMGPKVRSWYIKTLTFKLSKGSHRLTRPSRWFCNNFPKSKLLFRSLIWADWPIDDPLMTRWRFNTVTLPFLFSSVSYLSRRWTFFLLFNVSSCGFSMDR